MPNNQPVLSPMPSAESQIQHSAIFAKSGKKPGIKYMLIPVPNDSSPHDDADQVAADFLSQIIQQGHLTNEKNREERNTTGYFDNVKTNDLASQVQTRLSRANVVFGEPTLIAGFQLIGLRLNDLDAEKTIHNRTICIAPKIIDPANILELYIPEDHAFPEQLALSTRVVPATETCVGFTRVIVDQNYVRGLISRGLLAKAPAAEEAEVTPASARPGAAAAA